jgi:hypothetical protein
LRLNITEAIRTADTEYVVYFLLSAYVETLEHYDSSDDCLSDDVKRLPISGMPDVCKRVGALHAAIERYAQSRSRQFVEEAIKVFGAALQRLTYFQHAHQFVRSWLSLSVPARPMYQGAS